MPINAGPEVFHFLERRCKECPDTVPSCPNCPSGQTCSVTIQTCDQCQQTKCIAAPETASTSSASVTKSDPNVGAIAGGVIGGVAVVALLTYLVWRFCIKTKRQQYESEDWVEINQNTSSPEEKDFEFRRDQRASTHTVGSIASTVLTRASNIIQIAYIPGVTNRSAPSTPGLLVPPVPPIPIALAGSPGTTPGYEDQHFFMPGDLRDSTYSAMTSMTDRTSYAPRSSVASTIYGKNAVISPVAPQTVIRGKAAVVSVKSNGGSSPGDLTPPVPSVDYGRYAQNGPPSPAFSVGSTFLSSATAATASSGTHLRPTVVRVGSGGSKNSKASPSASEGPRGSPLGRESAAITVIDDTPSVEQGPFSDPPQRSLSHNKNGSLSALIEEATKKQQVSKDSTPFGDEHATDS